MIGKVNILNFNDTKAEFIRITSFWIAIIIFIASILRVFLTGFNIQKLLISFIVSFIMFYVSFAIRKTGFKKLYAYQMVIGFALIIINGAYFNGGFQAPVVSGIFIIPLFSSLLLEQFGVKIGILINLIIIAVIMILTKAQLIYPYNGKNSEIFYPIIFFATAFISYFILKAYLDIKNQTDVMMNKLYQEIILKAQISSLVGLVEGMSHEINNPLTVITLKNQKTIELLKNKQPLTPEDLTIAINNLEKVNESTKRITKVISSLFKFSQQIETEEAVEINLLDIINDAKDVVNFRSEVRNIKLTINIPNQLTIKTKKAQLSQAMVNLFNNAIDSFEDFQNTNAWVDISLLEMKKDFILMSITDNGKGIAPENFDKIFLPFFTTKDVGKGIGMGLSLSLGIVQSIGGDLWLDKKHENTRFIIKLPLKI